MRLGWGLRRIGRGVVLTLAGATAVAPALGAVVDRGPDGRLRVTAFHLALTTFDPSVWSMVARSVALAGAATTIAWLLGVGLARLARRSGRLGRPLAAVALAGLSVPPLFAALGLSAWVGPLRRAAGPYGGWAGEAAWLAAELSWAVPMVALATARALREVHANWEDAARLVGGGRRAWRAILRPVVRPTVARTLAWVFALCLAEPGAPLVLGLRRTLGFGLVEAALRPGLGPRAASLALLSMLIAVSVGLMLRAWGGPIVPAVPRQPPSAGPSRPGTLAVGLLALLVAATLALAPLVGLGRLALVGGGNQVETGSVAGTTAGPLSLPVVAAPTFLIGATAATLGLAVAWLATRRSDAPPRPGPGSALVLRLLPPMAISVGLATLPALVRTLTGAKGPDGPASLAGLASSPAAEPWLWLPWAVVLSHLPALMAAAGALEARARPELVEAARTLGLPRRRALWSATGRLLGPPGLAAWLRVAALGALDVASAIVLTPLARSRTLGPSVLDAALGPPGPGEAAALALAGAAIGLASASLASASGLASLAEEPAH